MIARAQIAALVLAGAILIGLALMLPDGQDAATQDDRNAASWLALARRQRSALEAFEAAARDDSITLARSRASFRRESLVSDSLRRLIRVDTNSQAMVGSDSTVMVFIARAIDPVPHRVPKYLVDAWSASLTALDTAQRALSDAENLDAQRRLVIATLKVMVSSRDSVIALREARIRDLHRRKLWDYAMAGCGYGIKGGDCVIGVRYPLGR